MPHALIPATDWPGLGTCTYLYTGAHAPAHRAAQEALRWAHAQQDYGPVGRQSLADEEVAARASIGRLARWPSDGVALVGDASTAWNSVANGLAWEAGDNVVVNDLEHPSVYYPFLRLKAHGLELRVVEHDDEWLVTPEAIAAACDAHTRAIAVSHVSYLNGYRHDIAALANEADRRGIPLLVDWSHALGVVPIDMASCAIGVSASYKWLLGPYGVGVILWNQERLPNFVPGGIGWRSTEDIFPPDRFDDVHISTDARRFQLGAPGYSNIAALHASVDALLALGPDAAAAHAEELSTAAIAGLRDLGLPVITPQSPDRRAGNVAFLHPNAETVATKLANAGVYVWGGDGRIRASFHVMNNDADVEALLRALRDVVAI